MFTPQFLKIEVSSSDCLVVHLIFFNYLAILHTKNYFDETHIYSVKSNYAKGLKISILNALLENIEVYGSPFESGSSALETLDFVSRMKTKPQSFHDTIKNNNVLIFKEKPPPKVSKIAQTFKLLKNDISLFSRLYIGAVNRTANLDEFFEHENQAFPVSISDNGNIRTSVKSKIVECLQKTITDLPHSQPTHCTAYLTDGSVNVRFVSSIDS